MNNRPIRNGIVLLVALALAGCAAHRADQRQTAARMCPAGQAITCEEFAGEYINCFCADRASLRRMFERHTTY